MGRGGIRRRIKRGRVVDGRSKPPYQEPDVIGDLEDQAQWSSYTQHIPRLGNEYRENLRLKRIYRFASGVVRPKTRPVGRDLPLAIGTTVALFVGVAVAVWLLIQIVRFFL